MSLIIKAAVHLEIVHFNIVYLAQNSYKTQKLENFHIKMNLNRSFQALEKDPRFSLYIDFKFQFNFNFNVSHTKQSFGFLRLGKYSKNWITFMT